MKKQGYLLTLLSAVIFGFTPTLASITYQLGSNGMTMAFLRHLFVIPVLYAIIKIKKFDLSIDKKTFISIIKVGVIGNALTVALLYNSYSYIGIGSATVLHFMYPAFVCLLNYFYYHDHLSKATVLSLIVATMGIGCFIEMSKGSLIGMAMALASGIFFAYYIVGVDKQQLGHLNPYVLNFYFAICIAISLGCIGVFTGQLVYGLGIDVYGISFVVAMLTSIIAIICLQQGIQRIGGLEASIMSMFEPVTSVICGILFLSEKMSMMKCLGSLLILGAIIYMMTKKEQNND